MVFRPVFVAFLSALALVPVANSWLASVPSPTARRYRHYQHNSAIRSRLHSSPSSSSVDVDLLEKIRSGIDEAGGTEAWNECTDVLVNALDGAFPTAADAELLLATAFSWKAWATCTSDLTRKYIQTEIPSPDQLKHSLSWLMEEGPLSLSSDQAFLAIQEYPKVYLTTPAESYKKSLNVAPRSFRTNEDTFVELIKQKPAAIQFTYNCEDEGCQSNCGSCWVTNGPSS